MEGNHLKVVRNRNFCSLRNSELLSKSHHRIQNKTKLKKKPKREEQAWSSKALRCKVGIGDTEAS